jgi:hypothetical protein
MEGVEKLTPGAGQSLAMLKATLFPRWGVKWVRFADEKQRSLPFASRTVGRVSFLPNTEITSGNDFWQPSEKLF